MAYIASCDGHGLGKYKLIADDGTTIKIFTEEDEPVDFTKEIEKYKGQTEQATIQQLEQRISELETLVQQLTQPAQLVKATIKKKSKKD